MAITITPTINIIDLDRKEAGVSLVRSDDATSPPTVTSYNIITALLDTPGQKADVLQDFKDQIEASDAKQAQIAAVKTAMETQLKTQLEAWELTR